MLVAVVVLYAGYAWWLHRQFAAIADAPELKLVPSTFQPARPRPLREIDLGYARLSVPAHFDGALIRYNDGVAVSFVAGNQQQPLLIWGPVHESAPAMREARQSIEKAVGAPMADLFEFEQRALSATPPGFLQILASQESRRQLALMAYKLMFLSGASEVRIYEQAPIGAIIVRTKDLLLLQLYERNLGIAQSFMLQPRDDHDLDATISAIVTTYRVTADARTDEEFLALVRSAGIPARPTPTPETALAQTEEERLAAVAAEVRQRRAQRQTP